MTKKIIVIIDDEIATTINFADTDNDFYRALVLEPDSIRQDTFDVKNGDIYDPETGMFTRDGNMVPTKYSPGNARFALVKDNIAKFAVEFPYSEELLVAAFSSSPIFEEVTNDESLARV
jgi:hypothetical protein